MKEPALIFSRLRNTLLSVYLYFFHIPGSLLLNIEYIGAGRFCLLCVLPILLKLPGTPVLHTP